MAHCRADLNGDKIANTTALARVPHAELETLLRGYRTTYSTFAELLRSTLAETIELQAVANRDIP